MQATSNHGGVQPQDQQDDGDMRAQFVQTLLSRRSEAIAGRAGSGIEEEWTEDEEHYQGIDDANRAYQNANQLFRGRKAAMIGTAPSNSSPTRSVVFLNITRPYTDAASARVSDMLLPTDDRAWEIKPTPLPRLNKSQLTMLAQSMGMADPAEAQAQIEVNQAQSQQSAAKMQEAIEDPLVESNWHGEVRQVIEDAARIGSGVLKGPFPIQRADRMVSRDAITGLTSVVRVDS